MSESPWEPLNEDFETPEPEYDEDGTEVSTTEIDPSNFPAGYIEALIEKYGAVTSIHSEDLGDFGIFGDEPEFQFPPESTE